MSYTLANGYAPRTWEELLTAMVEAVNAQFETKYTNESIVGTDVYKFFYGGLQLVMTAEGQTSELGNKLIDYIRTSNEEIGLPKGTVDGFLKLLKDDLNLIGSFAPIDTPEEAGKIHLAIDIDSTQEDYTQRKQIILELMHKFLDGGRYYYGTESGTVTALSGQDFPYAYELPSIKTFQVRIKVRISKNTSLFVMNENQVREKYVENFNSIYRLGYDYEPEKYLEINRDCPFASEILLEYSTDGTTWTDSIYKSSYGEKIVNGTITVEVS